MAIYKEVFMTQEINSSPDFGKHAKDLAETAISLITHIVEKHDAAILAEMHDQLKKNATMKLKN